MLRYRTDCFVHDPILSLLVGYMFTKHDLPDVLHGMPVGLINTGEGLQAYELTFKLW